MAKVITLVLVLRHSIETRSIGPLQPTCKPVAVETVDLNRTRPKCTECFFFPNSDGDLENHDVSKLSKEVLDTIEADSFWCMSKLLDGIQVINPKSDQHLSSPYNISP